MIATLVPELESVYRDLHEDPELAFHEQRTAATLANRLRALGFDVTTHVGGTGLVAVLRNGWGPGVMLRTELDALPIGRLDHHRTLTFSGLHSLDLN